MKNKDLFEKGDVICENYRYKNIILCSRITYIDNIHYHYNGINWHGYGATMKKLLEQRATKVPKLKRVLLYD